jgi:hypothetical protein
MNSNVAHRNRVTGQQKLLPPLRQTEASFLPLLYFFEFILEVTLAT